MHWDPQSLLLRVNPSLFTVNLELYRLDDEGKDWMHFLNVVKGQQNSGVAEFSVPSSDNDGSNFYPVAIRISVGDQVVMGNHDQEDASQLSDAIKSAQGVVSQWSSSFFYYVDSLNLIDECFQWYYNSSEPANIGETLLSRVPDCCQTAERAAATNSGFVRDSNQALVSFFHPGATSCYRQATITP